jgi:hypothetical protein
MPITGRGWELHVERLGLHERGALRRTYGRYAVFVDGAPSGLNGFMAETIGPGDNSVVDNGRRIEAGQYPLTTHYRAFVSAGYSLNETVVADPPMPAIRLLETNKRTGILIHPVYLPEAKLYVASVGCLNPTSAVGPEQNIDFWDSRARVIALIDSLRAFRPEAFATAAPTPIDGATVVIDGEPMDRLSA